MLSTGMKTPVGLKVLGNDVAALEELGRQVAAILADVPGTRNVYAEQFSEAFYIDIRAQSRRDWTIWSDRAGR